MRSFANKTFQSDFDTITATAKFLDINKVYVGLYGGATYSYRGLPPKLSDFDCVIIIDNPSSSVITNYYSELCLIDDIFISQTELFILYEKIRSRVSGRYFSPFIITLSQLECLIAAIEDTKNQSIDIPWVRSTPRERSCVLSLYNNSNTSLLYDCKQTKMIDQAFYQLKMPVIARTHGSSYLGLLLEILFTAQFSTTSDKLTMVLTKIASLFSEEIGLSNTNLVEGLSMSTRVYRSARNIYKSELRKNLGRNVSICKPRT